LPAFSLHLLAPELRPADRRERGHPPREPRKPRGRDEDDREFNDDDDDDWGREDRGSRRERPLGLLFPLPEQESP
jgi:hypothetical protein